MKREPIRIAVIQLGKSSDLFQSLMALRASQQHYPELEITLIVHEQNRGIAERCEWLREVVSVPTAQFLTPIIKKAKTAKTSIRDLATWIEPLVQTRYDIVANWTYNDSSSFLAAILPARVRLGYSRKPDGALSVKDGWSHYIYSIIQSPTLQSIHLTDLLTTQLLTALQVHFEDPLEEATGPSIQSKSFFKNEKRVSVCDHWNAPGIRWILIDLNTDTSTEPTHSSEFARLASMILRRHDDTRILLIGGEAGGEREKQFFKKLREEEKHSGQGSAIFERRLISRTGMLPFDLKLQIYSDAQWVISSDMANAQLASLLGTRTLIAGFESHRLLENGPYGNGHYCVAATNREAISAEALYAAWTYGSTEWQHRLGIPFNEHLKNLELTSIWKNVSLYRSKIRNGEEGGGLFYENLIEQPYTMDQWYAQVLGHMAREWYCGWVPPVGTELQRAGIHPELVQNLRKMKEGVDVLEKIFQEVQKSAEELKRKTKSLKSEKLMKVSDREQIQQIGLKLKELEDLITRVGNTQEPLAVFSRLSTILMHNLSGKTLNETAEETLGVYRFLTVGVGVLKKWIEHTLALAKPVAVPVSATVHALRGRKGKDHPSPSA